MKPATCPVHGRDRLVNAGAPNIVRCVVPHCGTSVLEPCQRCRGGGIADDVAFGAKRVRSACPDCEASGWVVRRKRLSSPYPVY
jgi:DnaJ-class molecular chaperone